MLILQLCIYYWLLITLSYVPFQELPLAEGHFHSMCPCWLQPASNNMSVVFQRLNPMTQLGTSPNSILDSDPSMLSLGGWSLWCSCTTVQLLSLQNHASFTSLHGLFLRRQASKPPLCESRCLCPGSLMEAYFHIYFLGQLGVI